MSMHKECGEQMSSYHLMNATRAAVITLNFPLAKHYLDECNRRLHLALDRILQNS